jgi:zinc/manganese transport system substrate-binding protein
MRLLRLAAVLVVASACTQTAEAQAPPGTITVVATTTQMQDLVRNVGGRRVHVVGILRPNVDPHDFEPTPSAVVALAGAKLVVESGVGLDAWADQLIDGAGTSAPVFDASAGLPLRPDDPHGGATRRSSSGRRSLWAAGWGRSIQAIAPPTGETPPAT